jgi:regulator of PEP synthase PpsR (kinase-PPPase family)
MFSSLAETFKNSEMNITVKEIEYVEKLLTKCGCPTIDCTPYAMQIIRHLKKTKQSVFDLELK